MQSVARGVSRRRPRTGQPPIVPIIASAVSGNITRSVNEGRSGTCFNVCTQSQSQECQLSVHTGSGWRNINGNMKMNMSIQMPMTMPMCSSIRKSGSISYQNGGNNNIRNLSTYRDKSGRRIVRRVRVIRNSNNNKSNGKILSSKSKNKTKSGYSIGMDAVSAAVSNSGINITRGVEKMISRIMLEQHPLPNMPNPINTFPQPIQPPQNIKFQPLMDTGKGKSIDKIKQGARDNSVSQSSKLATHTGTSSDITSASTSVTLPKSSTGMGDATRKATAAAIQPAAESSNATATAPTASMAVSSTSTTAASPTTAANAAKASQLGIALPTAKSRWKLIQWLKSNAGTIILNLGSIATLTAFTRTDMMDLRMLSITGSCSSIIYFLTRPPPIPFPPIIWSLVFACTNSFMLYHIYEERKGIPPPLSSLEQDVYDEHFLPHGVTPRMFEKLLHKSKKIHLKRGDVLLQKGHLYHSVYLVASGATNAVTGNMSRRVTAASSQQGNKESLAGGDAGAWVGELAFLDYLHKRDKDRGCGRAAAGPGPESGSNTTTATSPSSGESPAMAAKNNDRDNVSGGGNGNKHVHTNNNSTTAKTATIQQDKVRDAATKASILTYIATEESILYAWDHEELASLMETSSDLRSATTRAMTAAVVGKVVNMYTSKVDADDTPSWKKWMQTYGGGGISPSTSNITTSTAVKSGEDGSVVQRDREQEIAEVILYQPQPSLSTSTKNDK
jgi:hypothetical protein